MAKVPFAGARKSMAGLSEAMEIYPFDKEMYKENRAKLLACFEEGEGSILVLKGGETPSRYDTDYEPLFRQESNFAYLSGVKEPDCYLVLVVATKAAVLFVPRVDESYGVWKGHIRSLEEYKEEYGVDSVMFTDQLKTYVQDTNPPKIHTCFNPNPHEGRPYTMEAKFGWFKNYVVDNSELFTNVVRCRMIKSDKEVALMRHINRISSEAHLWVMANAKPGMYEFQLESMFNHYSYFHGQCRVESYLAICGSGERGAYLHYGHAAAPNDKKMNDGVMCLLDMGAEFRCYTSDITCSFPINGVFTDKQKLIYNAVLDAQWSVMEALKPGVHYRDMQLLSLRVICRHLLDIGILRNETPENLVVLGIGSVFMPHGLGHFLGLDTHDVGGSLQNYRMEKGMMITVEPGIYFNKYSMKKALENPMMSQYINKEALAEYKDFGGVRIEDDVLITEDGIENLTKCPRTIREVEKAMAGEIKSIDDIKENDF